MTGIDDHDPPCRLMVADSTIITEKWNGSLRDPFWRIYANGRDGASVLYPGGSHALAPGMLHLVPPWGDFRAACGARIEHDYLHIDAGDWAAGYFARPLGLPADDDRLAHFRRLTRGEAWSPAGRLRARALALDCLAAAFELLPEHERRRFAQIDPDDPVERARRFIAEHLAAPLCLDEIAARAGVSPGHLNHLFRQRFAQSCMRYLRVRRVAAAAERLILGEASIETIAEDLGFANRYHFTRLFSRVTGLGPAGYRRQHRR